MTRISRHVMFMEVAHAFAKRSSCARGNVGAVLVENKRIIGHGYNGPPAGEPHCSNETCAFLKKCQKSIHAEINALSMIDIESIQNRSLYVTDSPCQNCMSHIENEGITELYYDRLYRINDHLDRSPIKIYRLTPNGMLFDHKARKLIE